MILGLIHANAARELGKRYKLKINTRVTQTAEICKSW